MRTFRSTLLALCAINVLQLPALGAAVRDSLGGGPERVSTTACMPCSSSSEAVLSKQALHEALQNSPSGDGEGPSYPVCGDVICDVEPSLYTWTVCIKTQSSPLRCRYFTHPYKAWFCPGHTWYKCYGSWSGPGADCTPCSASTPGTLPSGCTPPVPPDWEQCV